MLLVCCSRTTLNDYIYCMFSVHCYSQGVVLTPVLLLFSEVIFFGLVNSIFGVKITPFEELFLWPINLYAKLIPFWELVKSNSLFLEYATRKQATRQNAQLLMCMSPACSPPLY